MSAPTPVPPIDEAKLNEFMGKAVADMGAAIHAVIIMLGDRLGLYKAMADCQPVSSAELAKRTGVSQPQLWRSMNGQRTLTLPAAARVCEYLGLQLKPGRKSARRDTPSA